MENHTFILSFINVWSSDSKNLIFDVNPNRSVAKTAAILYAVMLRAGGKVVIADYEEFAIMATELHEFIADETRFKNGVNIYPVPLGYDSNPLMVYATSNFFGLDGVVSFEKSINFSAFNVVSRFGHKFGDIDGDSDFKLRIPYLIIETPNKENPSDKSYVEMVVIDNEFHYSEVEAERSVLRSISSLGLSDSVAKASVKFIIGRLTSIKFDKMNTDEISFKVNKNKNDLFNVRVGFFEEKEIDNLFFDF